MRIKFDLIYLILLLLNKNPEIRKSVSFEHLKEDSNFFIENVFSSITKLPETKKEFKSGNLFRYEPMIIHLCYSITSLIGIQPSIPTPLGNSTVSLYECTIKLNEIEYKTKEIINIEPCEFNLEARSIILAQNQINASIETSGEYERVVDKPQLEVFGTTEIVYILTYDKEFTVVTNTSELVIQPDDINSLISDPSTITSTIY